MTDFQKAREAAVRALAKAVGYDYDTLYANKREWVNDRGNRHDVNTPYKFDFEDGVDAALSAFSAHGWELAKKKEDWCLVPIEVENACMNWLANRIQGNGHGEDIELGRLMRGLQTYIKAVADGTNK